MKLINKLYIIIAITLACLAYSQIPAFSNQLANQNIRIGLFFNSTALPQAQIKASNLNILNENNFEIAIPDVVKVICDKFNYIKAPLWQQVTAWFRNKYKMSIEINLIDNCIEYYYEYSIVCSNNRQHNDGEMLDQAEILYNDLKFKSYEEAREAAILKAIELRKTIHN